MEAVAMGTEERLWTVKDVAKYLGVGVSSVYQLAQEGKIPSRVICRKRRFLPSEVREWAAKQAKGG